MSGNGTAIFTGDGNPAITGSLSGPSGVAVDVSGNIYIADYNNHRIRKVTASTCIITTVAGNGTATFAGDGGAATAASFRNPCGIELDGSVNVYF